MTYRNPMRIAAAMVALAATFALTGCFANPLENIGNQISGNSGEQIAEDLIENLTGGEMDLGVGSLPADFPQEVSLIDGEILHSVQVPLEDGVTGTQVVVQSSLSIAEAAEAVYADFANWEEAMWTEAAAGTMVSGQFQKDDMMVIIGVMEGDDGAGSTVSYMVYTK